ncbi:MAG: hypothetical protein XE05_1616, partial [Thermotogales bacterium 46_20]
MRRTLIVSIAVALITVLMVSTTSLAATPTPEGFDKYLV